METERVSFVEAVRSLAERAGIKIPEEGKDEKAQEETDRLHNALRFAGRLFHDNLTKTDEGRTALEYFKQRGFSDETLRAFGLGYALNSWDNLLTHARREGIRDEDLLAAGLLRKREDGTSFYDYFRGRAMFPILSAAGRVVAFGARKMRDDDPIQGKYINSPETPVYSKSRVLFGLSHAKEAIRQLDAVLLVEGYADMISLFQAGVQNVVASSGTALTEDQLSCSAATRRISSSSTTAILPARALRSEGSTWRSRRTWTCASSPCLPAKIPIRSSETTGRRCSATCSAKRSPSSTSKP
jgi:DNA primase